MKKIYLLGVAMAMICFTAQSQNDPTSDDWLTGTFTSTLNRVGIGTTNPQFDLQIRGLGIQTFEVQSDDNQVTWALDNTGSNAKTIRFRTLGSTKGGIQMPGGTEELRFQTGGPIDRMTVKADGKVGVGTIAPATTFDVAGELRTVSLLAGAAISGHSAFVNETDGFLGIQGSTDFNGQLSLDILGEEIGVLGISAGSSSGDNFGLYGFSNGTAIRAVHEQNNNSVDLATQVLAINSLGDCRFAGETEFISNELNGQTSRGAVNLSLNDGNGISIDHNEIQRYATDTIAGGTLFLNFWAGDVDISHDFTGSDADVSIHNNTIHVDGLDDEVGIGTSAPLAKLHVNGTTRLDGNVGINTAPTVWDLTVGSTTGAAINIGSLEIISDGGSNTLLFTSADLDPAANLSQDMASAGTAWDDIYADDFINVSDRRAKMSISELKYGLVEILQLHPVSYLMKEDLQEEIKLGLIAQDVLEIVPEAVKTHDLQFDEEGNMSIVKMELMAMRYNALIPVLINAVKELNQEIEELEKAANGNEIEALENVIKDLESKLDEKSDKINSLEISMHSVMEQLTQFDLDLQQCCLQHQTGSTHGNGSSNGFSIDDKAHLAQNVPNPFSEKTIIKYYIPGERIKDKRESTVIRVMDLKGTVLWRYDLVENGYGQIEIDANTFAPATYIYELIVGDKKIDSKKMTISN